MAEEKNFENKIKHYLDEIGAWHLKYHGNAFSANGTPDLLICLNGVFMAVEVKATRGRPTKLQQYKINLINKAGGVAMVLYPKDFNNFKKLCEAVLNCNIHTQEWTVLKAVLSNINCDTSTD